MGWGSGVNEKGREVGYNIAATCDLDGCEKDIDRGLAYVCGGMHDGGDYGCGDYFCGEHLFMPSRDGIGAFLCDACCQRVDSPSYQDG